MRPPLETDIEEADSHATKRIRNRNVALIHEKKVFTLPVNRGPPLINVNNWTARFNYLNDAANLLPTTQPTGSKVLLIYFCACL